MLGWPSGQTLFLPVQRRGRVRVGRLALGFPLSVASPLPSPDAIMLICSLGRFRARLLAVAELQVSVLG